MKRCRHLVIYITDCLNTSSHYHKHNGQYRCVNVATVNAPVDMDTGRVEVCVERFGSAAKLLALPKDETELWNLVNNNWTSV